MAENAEVIVKNRLRVEGDVKVSRKLPDGKTDFNAAIAWHKKGKVVLPDPDVSLIIAAPAGMDTRDCPITVLSDVDLIINYSRSKSFWQMRIDPNDLPPQVPTTVNVNIGEDEPEPPEGGN
jgi:hypothetical protein